MTKATKPTVSYEGKLYGFDASAKGGGQWRMIGTTGGYGKFLRKEVQDQWGKPVTGEALESMPKEAPKTNTAVSNKASKKMERSSRLAFEQNRNELISELLGKNVADLISLFFDKKKNTENDLLKSNKSISSGKSLKTEDIEKAELVAQTKTNDLQKETNKLLEKNNEILISLVKFFKDQSRKSDISGDIRTMSPTQAGPLERLGGATDVRENTNSGNTDSSGGLGLFNIFNPFSAGKVSGTADTTTKSDAGKARGRLLKEGTGRFLGKISSFGKSVVGNIGSAGVSIASNLAGPSMSTMEPIATPKAPVSQAAGAAKSGAGAVAGEAAGAAKSGAGTAGTAAKSGAGAVAGEAAGAAKSGAGTAAKSGLKFGSKVLKGLGPIATVLGIGATVYELYNLKQELNAAVESGKMTEAEADKTFKKESIKAIGGSLGALGGGLAGAALGSMIVPGFGTVFGGLAGGIAGGFGGEWLAEKLYDFLDSGKEVDPDKLKKEVENPDKSKDLKGAPSSMPSMPSFDGGIPMSDIGTPTPTSTASAITPTPTVSSAEMMIPELRQTGKAVLGSSDQLNETTRAYAMPVGAPVVNNIVNNMGGGGGTVSVPSPTSSARNDDSAYRRAQDRLYMPA